MTPSRSSCTLPENTAPTVTVIIPTCNRDDLLESCLKHLKRQTFQSFQILVVDNGARDSMPPALGSFPNLRWIPLFGNRGTATAFNRGLAESKHGPFVLLLNNDAELENDCLACLVEALSNHPEYSIAVPKLLQWSDPDRLDGAGDDMLLGAGAYRVGQGELDRGQYNKPEPVLSACGAAALYRRTLFDDIGNFDEDFFAYREDVDLCLRALWRKHQCVFVPQACVRHRGSATLGSTFHPRVIRLTTRNQVFLLVKNYPASLLLRLAPRLASFQILWVVLALKKRAFFSCCLGFWDAIPLLPKMLGKRRVILRTRLLSNADVLGRLRASEGRIWRWHVSAHRTHRSQLLSAYFWIFGRPSARIGIP